MKMNQKWNSIKLGVKKGLSISMLPPAVERFYTNPIVRVFRVIGGICLTLLILKKYTLFIYPLNYVIMFLGVLQIILIIIISWIKIIYSIYRLIKDPKDFEVINSPLDSLATHITKLIFCWKFSCGAIGNTVAVIAGGAAVDLVLEEAGYEKVFVPLLGKTLAGLTGKVNADNSSGSKSSKKLIESLYVLNNDTTENLNNNLNNTSVISEKINEFPLSLIPEINQLATAELMFLLIILNIFIVKYITTLDFNKYLPNNKVGNILKKIINRYIWLWSKSVNIMLIVSWSGLFFCVIFSKIFLYYVLNS